MTLATRVKAAMERKGCDARELAEACRIKAPSVHGWLNGGSHSMMAGPAIRAAAYLEVSVLWLAEGEGPMLPPPGALLVPVGPKPESKEGSSSHTPSRHLVRKVCEIAESINDIGLKKVVRLLDGIPDIHPIKRARKKGARVA